MTKASGSLSRQAVAARGALIVYLDPRMAADAKIDLAAVLNGTTAKTWKADAPRIAQDIKERLAGKLAKDADLDGLGPMLQKLIGAEPEEPDVNGNNTVVDAGEQELRGMLAGKHTPEEIERICAMMKGSNGMGEEGMDEPPKFEGEPKTPEEKEARDSAMDKWAKDRMDRKAARDAKAAKDAEVKEDAGGGGAERNPDMVSKGAMDAAIASAVTAATSATITRMNSITKARDDVRPLIGDVSGAFDSASQVYRLALDHAKVDYKGVHESAYPALVALIPKPGVVRNDKASARLAHDASAAASFATMFPNAAKVGRV